MINLNSKRIQKLKGRFFLNSSKSFTTDIDIFCFLKFDLENMDKSFLYSYDCRIFPLSWGDISFITTTNEKIVLGQASGNSRLPNYSIEKIIINKPSENVFVANSGFLYSQLYFDKTQYLLDVEIKLITINGDKNSQTKFYYSLSSSKPLSDSDLQKYFLLISLQTGSKIFLRELITKTTYCIVNQYSKDRTLIIWGSGRLLFPIRESDLVQLLQSLNSDFLIDLIYLYTNFTTAEGLKQQLFHGSVILDYLIELFIWINNSRVLGSGNKSSKLWELLKILLINNNQQFNYVSFILNVNDGKIEKNDKFQLFELRDKIMHRGFIFKSDDDYKILIDSIFNINEIVRIIILNINQYKFSNHSEDNKYNIIPSRGIEDSIDLRRQTINKIW